VWSSVDRRPRLVPTPHNRLAVAAKPIAWQLTRIATGASRRAAEQRPKQAFGLLRLRTTRILAFLRRVLLLREGPTPTFFRLTHVHHCVLRVKGRELNWIPHSCQTFAWGLLQALVDDLGPSPTLTLLPRMCVVRPPTRCPTRWSTGGVVEIAIRCRRLGVCAMTQPRRTRITCTTNVR